MALGKPMQGLLDRTGWSAIPTAMQNPTSGVGGVVANLWWGDLMVGTPNSAGPTYSAAIGSTNFNLDLQSIEGSNTGAGSLAVLLADMNGVENGGTLVSGVNTPNSAKKLAAGSQVKIRMFTNVGAVGSFTNPPTPTWLVSQTGFVLSNDPATATNVHPYWVSGEVQANADLVVSPANGLQYTCNTSIWASSGTTNTVDPSTSSHFTIKNAGAGAPGYSKGAGPCCTWFGPNHAVYLAAYAYWQLLMANTRVFVTNHTYTAAGQGGNWYAGPLPQTIGGVTYTTSNAKQFTLDTCPLIGEVTMSACTTIYGECCVRQISSGSWPATQYLDVTQASFIAAGYTPYQGGTSTSLGSGTLTPFAPAPDSDIGQLLACQTACATAWANTCISEAHNPFQMHSFTPGQAGSASTTITTDLITHLTQVCNPGQAVPGNNSPDGAAGYDGGIMPIVGAAGPPIYFQTQNAPGANPGGFGSFTLAQVIAQCESVGAWNIELPAGYGTLFGTGSTSAPSLAAALAGYISAGTGPPGFTTVYSTSNTRQQTAGPVWSADTPTLSATVGSAYSYTLVASNTTSYTKTAGSFPAGLSLNSATGVISGTPTSGGNTTFVVTARGPGGSETSQVMSIDVTVPSGSPVFSADDPPDGVLGVTYDGSGYTCAASGTPTWAVSPASPSWLTLTGLPPGLSINASTGVISGTPYGIPATWTFSIIATNSFGSNTASGVTIAVTDPALIFSTGVAHIHTGGAWKPVRVSKV